MADNSVLAKLRKLDEERNRLLEEAKSTALANAEKALEELNELGFNYRLVEGGTTASAPRASTQPGTRRRGIRDDVLATISEASPDGIAPADIRAKLGIAQDDKSGAQSVANALSNLKKTGKITDKNGLYIVP